jgi:lipoic acid synthetase
MKKFVPNTLSLSKPSWIRVPFPAGRNVDSLRKLKTQKKLHTVCESALCPNIGICWDSGQATFMIMGNGCSRDCFFCALKGPLQPIDYNEPLRVAEAVKSMGLKHAVITSVTRDDVPDGGASVFVDTITCIRKLCLNTSVEVLIPDFMGNRQALAQVTNARPDILGHNIETIPRLYQTVRPASDFSRSLNLLETVKTLNPSIITKSGLMVGLGEIEDEILETFGYLQSVGVDILTIGQYLRPGPGQLPVIRYYHPDEFICLKTMALAMGFLWVESGPLVRSSFQAEKQASFFKNRNKETQDGTGRFQKSFR